MAFKIKVFDVLLLDNLCLLEKRYMDRRRLLEGMNYSKHVSKIGSILVNGADGPTIESALKNQYNQAKLDGNEGLVLKRNDEAAIYEPGSRKHWYKLKYTDSSQKESLDLIVIGGYFGEVSSQGQAETSIWFFSARDADRHRAHLPGDQSRFWFQRGAHCRADRKI